MKQRMTKLQRAGTWAAVGSVLAAGALVGNAQEVLPVSPAPFQGQSGLRYTQLRTTALQAAEAGSRAAE